MIYRAMLFVIAVMFAATDAHAQQPLPQRTPETDAEALRLMRIEKLDLILPGAMRDNNVDMWIHVTRAGDQDRQRGAPAAWQRPPESGCRDQLPRAPRLASGLYRVNQ